MYLVGDVSSATLVGVATVAVLFAAAYVVIALLWRSWDGKDVARFFAREAGYLKANRYGGLQFVLFVASLVVLLAVAIVIAATGNY
jgi:hypothetical protein